ncbi:MAG: histidine kinase, partial [Microcoleus sp.]
AKGDEIPLASANSRRLRGSGRSPAAGSAAKVLIGEDEDSFSVFAEKLATNSLYCDIGRQRR